MAGHSLKTLRFSSFDKIKLKTYVFAQLRSRPLKIGIFQTDVRIFLIFFSF